MDCVIIGGGPAGLNAALVLGRARRQVALLDHNMPRNRVTQKSHGFITRDGVKPAEFREAAHRDIAKYPSVAVKRAAVTEAAAEAGGFRVVTEAGETLLARTLLLATGLSETLPAVPGLHDYYGTSLFSCPYCDGWELQDRPLAVFAENDHAFPMARTLYQWTKDIIVFTNGRQALTGEQREKLESRGIQAVETRIRALRGSGGMLEAVALEDGRELARSGGFIAAGHSQAAPFAEALGCRRTGLGGIETDGFGRTSVKGVFAAGDAAAVAPAQLVVAAGEGSRAAIGINMMLTEEDF